MPGARGGVSSQAEGDASSLTCPSDDSEGQCPGSYQVAAVGGAGTLLGDAHAEAGQATIGVAGAQVEVVGPAATAGEAFCLGLRGQTEGRVWGDWGASCSSTGL